MGVRITDLPIHWLYHERATVFMENARDVIEVTSWSACMGVFQQWAGSSCINLPFGIKSNHVVVCKWVVSN